MAKKILPQGDLKNIMPTAAIRMGDGHVVHSCGDCEVEVPMGSRSIAHRLHVMDTEAFDFVLGTDFFVQHSQILSLTLQAPYVLQVAHGDSKLFPLRKLRGAWLEGSGPAWGKGTEGRYPFCASRRYAGVGAEALPLGSMRYKHDSEDNEDEDTNLQKIPHYKKM